MHLPTRLIFIFITLLSVFFISPSIILAQDTSPPPAPSDSYVFQDPENFAASLDDCRKNNTVSAECYLNFVSDAQINVLLCKTGGLFCTNDENLQQIFEEGSLMNQTGRLIGVLYENPPANSGIWVASVVSNMGIIPKAYAQGIGFSALSPILQLWRAMRNVAYALIILVLLLIGVMVILRTKIDPRTVISVQSALPRIVITFLIITFSYPIAGLMIDLMYVTLFLGINIVGPAANFTTPEQLSALQADFAAGNGIYRLVSDTVPQGFWIGGVWGLVSLLFSPIRIARVIGILATNIQGTVARTFLGANALTGLLMLIIILAFLFALVRIFFILLNAYIQLIIGVIFAPILLLGQAIPGQSSFSNWIKNLLSNLVVFPATAILIVVARAVSNAYLRGGPFGSGSTTGPSWVPPMLGGFGKELGEVLIALGFALVIPQIVMSIKNLFKAKPVIPVGPGAITGPVFGGLQQALQLGYYVRGIGSPSTGAREAAQPASQTGKKKP